MKIGDQKQAIALGVVAVGALGFLGKTAIGMFSGSAPRPLVVKELRGSASADNPDPTDSKATTEPKTDEQTETKTSEATPIEATANDATPKLEPAPKATATIQVPLRDAFAKFPTQAKKDSPPVSQPKPIHIPKETMTQTSSTDEGGDVMPKSPFTGDISGPGSKLPNAQPSDGMQSPVKKEPIKLRFDGFIDAGKPMAVITFKDSTFNVAIGDFIDTDVVIKSITGQRIIVRVGPMLKTIFVGREIEL